MKTQEALTKAKMKLVLTQPFFATLALGMEYKENNGIKTMRTDGKSIEYSSYYVDKTPPDELVCTIAHEVLHPAMLHHTRKGKRNHELWNEAADYAVNLLLKDSGFKIPMNWLLDERFRNMTAEQIYAKLEKEQNQQGKSQPQDCGPGEVTEPEGEDIQQAEAESKQKLAQAIAVAKQAGKGVSSIQQQAVAIFEPKLDWREVLQRFIAEVAKNDYSWSKPSPRFLPMGLYLPILESMEVGKCIFAIDTSMSVNEKVLGIFASELKEASTLFRFPVTVLHCDTAVRYEEELEPESDIVPQGRGFTDFRPPFKYVEDNGLDIKALIYLTDGECNDFPKEPDYPTLWVIYDNKRFSPPFGEVIFI